MKNNSVTVKEHSTRIKDDQYTFKLNIQDTGAVSVALSSLKGPVAFETVQRDDIVGQHLRETLAIFLTGKT